MQEIVSEGCYNFQLIAPGLHKSKLMEEISINLREKKTQEERVQFLTYLLQPFIPYAYAFHPIALISKLEQDIKNLQKEIRRWKEEVIPKFGPSIYPKVLSDEQAKAIVSREKCIDYLKQVSTRFKAFADHGRANRSVPGENLRMCQCLATWYDAMVLFGCKLAALALTYGIDLNEVQQQCQIFLFPNYAPIHCVDGQFVFSEEHALQLLDKIKRPKEEQPKINILPIQIVTPQPTQTEKAVIGKKDTYRTDCCFLYNNDNKEYFNVAITECTNKLHKYKRIPESIDYKMMLALFSGQPCKYTYQWLGSKAELTSIIKKLCPDRANNPTITTWPPNTPKWYVVAQRFVDENENPMNSIERYKEGKTEKTMIKEITDAFIKNLPQKRRSTT